MMYSKTDVPTSADCQIRNVVTNIILNIIKTRYTTAVAAGLSNMLRYSNWLVAYTRGAITVFISGHFYSLGERRKDV